jgi:hypothetical protein
MIHEMPVPGTDVADKGVISLPATSQTAVRVTHWVQCGMVELQVTAVVSAEELNEFVPAGQTLSANWLFRLITDLFMSTPYKTKN